MTALVIKPLAESEFTALAPTVWNRLVTGMVRPNVFSTHEWLRTWWKHYAGGYSFYFLAVWQGNTLAGALPLVKKRVAIEDGVIPVRVIMLAGSREVAPDHLDVLAEPGLGAAVAQAVVGFLAAHADEWDLLHLSHVDEDGVLKQILAEGGPSHTDVVELSLAPYIPVTGGFDDFMERSFRGKKRRQMDAWHRKVHDEGMQMRLCAVGEEERVVNELFRLHSLRATEKDIVSSFKGSVLRAFHTELAAVLNKSGYLNTLYLEREGTIYGVLYCFRYGTTVYWYQIGVDPQFSKLSLGTVLVYELIKRAHENGMSELDLLRGPGPHKSRWTKETRLLYGINIYNRTWAGQLQKMVFRGRRRVVGALKSLVGKKAARHAER